MTYTFVDISASKFTINGRILFKTFIPFFVDDTHIKVFNIYDSKCPLTPVTHVSEIEVDGVEYDNATDLINTLHGVLFSRTVTGDVNNEQIELNRLAIIDLQNNKADVNHNHDSRYYTKPQIQELIEGIVSSDNLLNRGEVDGDDIHFYDRTNNLVFTVDAKAFTRQGTSLGFDNGRLSLKNDKGEVLDSVAVKAKEPYYDTFEFQDNIEDDLNDFAQNGRFTLAKTTSGLHFFVSQKTNEEELKNARIYINDIELFFDLETPTYENEQWEAWEITIPEEKDPFIEGETYGFNLWARGMPYIPDLEEVALQGNVTSKTLQIAAAMQETEALTGKNSGFGLSWDETDKKIVWGKREGDVRYLGVDTDIFLLGLDPNEHPDADTPFFLLGKSQKSLGIDAGTYDDNGSQVRATVVGQVSEIMGEMVPEMTMQVRRGADVSGFIFRVNESIDSGRRSIFRLIAPGVLIQGTDTDNGTLDLNASTLNISVANEVNISKIPRIRAVDAKPENDKDLTTKEYVDSKKSYKSYEAIINQVGTNNPTVTVLNNDLEDTITFSRTNAGIYTVTASSEIFTPNKTGAAISSTFHADDGAPCVNSCKVMNATTINIRTSKSGNSTTVDTCLNDACMEIRVYE